MKELQKRLTACEVQIGKLVQVVNGMAAAVQQGSQLRATCGTCEDDIEAKKYCAEEACPCGKSPRPQEDAE
jgi:hypothetical protein